MPKECNPFHHPIRPLLLDGERSTRVREELEDPRQVRDRDDTPPVITVGRVAYRDLSKVLTGARRPRQTAGGWGAMSQGAQPSTGWGTGTPTTPTAQNTGWGAGTTNGWGAGTQVTPNAQNTGGGAGQALDGQQAGQGQGTSHADGWSTTGTPTGARQDAPMTDQDEQMRPPLSEHVIRPKLLTYEVQIDVRMCNGITADQDPVMRTDGDAGRNMGDGSGSRRHEGETVTDQRLRLMTDTWKQMPETYRSQVRDELRTGRCQDARHEEIFDDLCPPAIRIPTGVPEVRVSEMVNALWVVTGLRDDARREQLLAHSSKAVGQKLAGSSRRPSGSRG